MKRQIGKIETLSNGEVKLSIYLQKEQIPPDLMAYNFETVTIRKGEAENVDRLEFYTGMKQAFDVFSDIMSQEIDAMRGGNMNDICEAYFQVAADCVGDLEAKELMQAKLEEMEHEKHIYPGKAVTPPHTIIDGDSENEAGELKVDNIYRSSGCSPETKLTITDEPGIPLGNHPPQKPVDVFIGEGRMPKEVE